MILSDSNLQYLGVGLAIGIKASRMYDSEHLLRLKLESALDTCYNKCYQLVEDLNKKPKEVTKVNWLITGLCSTLSVILTTVTYLLITK